MRTETSCAQNDWCESGYAERPRYYARQIITPDDLTLGVEYLLKLQRRHNRLLHGWGVVCGAQVVPVIPADGSGTARPWKVLVKPGYILDPYGREILLDREVCFDLRQRCVTGVTGEACGETIDPWCSDVYVKPEEDGIAYVAVKYKQIQSRPVRVQPVGCGCDDTACEFSRWRDAYEICTLDDCPDSHQHPPAPHEPGGPGGEHTHDATAIPDCPECPSEPWVVLAEVRLDAEGEIQYIDNCSCRRLVRSFAHEWWRCETMTVEPVQQTLTRGAAEQTIEIKGMRLVKTARILLPRGVTETAREISEPSASGEVTLTLKVTVESRAELGPQPILIVHPDGTTRRGTLTIAEKTERDGGRAVPPAGGKPSLRRPRREA
jgi:hypothetical protein